MERINLYNSNLYQNKEINTSGIAVNSSSKCSLIRPLNVKGGSQFTMYTTKCGFSQYKIHEYDMNMSYLGATLITLPVKSTFKDETKYFNLELSARTYDMTIDGAKITLEFESLGNHQKVFAICENKCFEEIMRKEEIEKYLPHIIYAEQGSSSIDDPEIITWYINDPDITQNAQILALFNIYEEPLMSGSSETVEMIEGIDLSNIKDINQYVIGTQNKMNFKLLGSYTKVRVIYVRDVLEV